MHNCLGLLSLRTRSAILETVTEETVGRSRFFRELDSECRAYFAGLLRPLCVNAGQVRFATFLHCMRARRY